MTPKRKLTRYASRLSRVELTWKSVVLLALFLLFRRSWESWLVLALAIWTLSRPRWDTDDFNAEDSV